MLCIVTIPAAENKTHIFFQQQSSPFRRVRAEEVDVDVRVANNSFDAKVRRDLIATLQTVYKICTN